MEGHRQSSGLVGRGEWSGIDSAHGLLEGVIGGHRQCSLLIGRGGWRGIESAHG